jgi:hypothetical protein
MKAPIDTLSVLVQDFIIIHYQFTSNEQKTTMYDFYSAPHANETRSCSYRMNNLLTVKIRKDNILTNKMIRDSNSIFLLLLVCCGLTSSNAFRLIEFELRPTITPGAAPFTCIDSIATAIEKTAEICLVDHCTEYVSEISFSYSSCTAENNIEIAGGVSVNNNGTVVFDTIIADTCINNRLESEECKDLFAVEIPDLSSISFVTDSLLETSTPTRAPTRTPPSAVNTPVLTSSPTFVPTNGVIMSTGKPSNAPAQEQATPSAVGRTIAPTMVKAPTNESSSPVTSGEVNSQSKGNNSIRYSAAVFTLAGVTALLVIYLIATKMKKRRNGQKSTTIAGRGPLDTTDTAFDNDDDVELGGKQLDLPQSERATSTSRKSNKADLPNSRSLTNENQLDGFIGSAHTLESADENIEYNGSLVPEDDELSSDSSTLFDVNGRNCYDDCDSSVFYESHGEEEDEEGTEVELDGTWGPDESSVNSGGMDRGDDQEESVKGSTISSLGASGVDNFSSNPSPHQFMEWIKKSPLIPAAAKASIVAAAAAEAATIEKMSPPPSPSTLPINFDMTVNSDTSGRQSW